MKHALMDIGFMLEENAISNAINVLIKGIASSQGL
jgi:hypothetical protein